MIVNISIVDTWFQYWRSKPQACIRLFCFPHAGGGASLFRTWSEGFPLEIEICPVQLPGRENRLSEKPFSEVHLLVGALGSILLPYLDRPYAFFGHSMGALISFELARHLRRIGHSSNLIHLFVSGYPAPQLPDFDPPLSPLPEKEFIKRLRDFNGTPEAVLQNEELLHLFLPLLKADFALCEGYAYVHELPFCCPVTAIGGLQDNTVPPSKVMAWGEQTSSTFTSRFLAGDHFFLQKEQASLLRVIAQDLLKALP